MNERRNEDCNRPLVVLHAPSPLGLMPPAPGEVPGTIGMPQALCEAGLHEQLGAGAAIEVPPPAYDPELDLRHHVLNPYSNRAYAIELADAVGRVLDDGGLPLVLGGDCSILLGCALALRRRGCYGLVHIDGHADLLVPATSATGGIAGMDLAIVTGSGPPLLTDIEQIGPMVREEHVVQLGCRDHASFSVDSDGFATSTKLRLVSLDEIRERGLGAVVQETIARLAGPCEGMWVHVDVDVLHDDVMPAVDSRQPDGLWRSELLELLTALMDSGRVMGLDFTIYDPARDPTRRHARMLADFIGDVFHRA